MIGSVSKVKLRGGTVGKVCTVLIVVALAAAAIAWASRSVWVSITALVLVCAMSFALLWRLLSFADRHPQAALFEGAEFLAHEQMRMAMKSTPILPDDKLPPVPPTKVMPKADSTQAALPDATDG